MSMGDRSFCATECEQKNCERNIKYHEPGNIFKIYTVSKFDVDNPDPKHKTCEYKIIARDKRKTYDEETIQFVKTQIEKLRTTTKIENEVMIANIFSDDWLDKIYGPVHDVAYNLLKTIYDVSGDKEDYIYNQFTLYLYGEQYKTLDEFFDWLEEV